MRPRQCGIDGKGSIVSQKQERGAYTRSVIDAILNGCSTLRQIAERRPSTLAELADIPGMGDQKIERFGAAFLAILREA